MNNSMEYELSTEPHIMEVYASGNTYSQTLKQSLSQEQAMSHFALSLLTGMMVHPASSFTTEPSTSSVKMEWLQEYTI